MFSCETSQRWPTWSISARGAAYGMKTNVDTYAIILNHVKPELYATSIAIVELDVMKTLNELYVLKLSIDVLESQTDRRMKGKICTDLLLRAFWPKMSYGLN